LAPGVEAGPQKAMHSISLALRHSQARGLAGKAYRARSFQLSDMSSVFGVLLRPQENTTESEGHVASKIPFPVLVMLKNPSKSKKYHSSWNLNLNFSVHWFIESRIIESSAH